MAANPPATAAPRVAMLAGASGMTGGALLRLLLDDAAFNRVLALSRRPLPLEHPKLANRILPFDDLARRLKGARCTDAFCALGAPGGPQADDATLRAVDLSMVVDFGRAALAAGATRLVVVSAAGAKTGAAPAFQRIKGEMEVAVRALGIAAVDFMRPALVYGSRRGQGLAGTLRVGILTLAAPLLERTRMVPDAISGEALAMAMRRAAHTGRRGEASWSGPSLRRLASEPARIR